MDLSFRLSDPAETTLPSADLALLVALLADRQAASATARVQAALPAAEVLSLDAPLAPTDGAFNGAMAALLREWTQP